MRSILTRLAIVSACTAACASDDLSQSPEQAAAAVAVANPGFESDFSGWTEVEPASISSVAHSGSRSGKVSSPGGLVKQTVSGLTPATSYTVSAWVLGDVRLAVRDSGGATASTSKSASSWAQTSVTFTTGAASSSAELSAAWLSGGDARVDDLTIAAAPAAPVTVAPTLPAAGVSASSSDTNVAASAVDGNLTTRWSGYGDGVWLRVDLGAAATVTAVKVAVYNGTTRRNRYDLQVSSDGSAWTTVWSGQSSGTTNALELIDVPDSAARYVRYVGHGYTTGTTTTMWSSVTELEVHGTAGTSAPPPTTSPPPPPSTPPDCSLPSQLLDLSGWKLTLPVGDPTEILQPALATFTSTPWFLPDTSCAGVRFRAHTSGSTTDNSGYPRSELREMTGGTSEASWSTTSGTHRMFIDEAITAVPKGKKHVVAGQIHDSSDDVIVIRLEYPKLFVDINGTDGVTLDANYTLGKRFTVEFEASGGNIKVYYNGSTTPAQTIKRSRTGCYFKAGVYTQSNCSTEATAGVTCSADDYGEVVIHDLWVRHQ